MRSKIRLALAVNYSYWSTDDMILRWEHNKGYTWWESVGVSSRLADWPAVFDPLLSRCWLLWIYEFENAKVRKPRNPAARKIHHEINSRPRTATTLKRRTANHVPCVSHTRPLRNISGSWTSALYSSQNRKKPRMLHIHRRTDRTRKLWHLIRTPVWRGLFADRQKTA